VKYSDKTVAECKDLCDADSSCVAFEYGVGHGSSDTTYAAKDCQPQSAMDETGCDGADLNLDLYKKVGK